LDPADFIDENQYFLIILLHFIKFGKDDPPVYRRIESCDHNAMVFPGVDAHDCGGGVSA